MWGGHPGKPSRTRYLAAGAARMLPKGEHRSLKFPTVSDSERVNMRQDRFSVWKLKSVFRPLSTSYIGVLKNF